MRYLVPASLILTVTLQTVAGAQDSSSVRPTVLSLAVAKHASFHYPSSRIVQLFPARSFSPEPSPAGRAGFFRGDSVSVTQPSVLRPIAGGLLGAVAGMAVGGIFAGKVGVEGGADGYGAALGFLAGIILGEPWGAACGVHIGNGRRGKLAPALVATTLVAASGVALAVATGDWKPLLAIPLVQVAVAVPIERSTAAAAPRNYRLCRL